MTELERLRFYLRDTGSRQTFTDEQLQELLDHTSSFEEAVGLGWLLKASESHSRVTSKTIGKVSETYSGATESAQTALAMSQYWFGKAGTSVARWLEVRPAGGFIGELLDVIDALALEPSYDFSRLIP